MSPTAVPPPRPTADTTTLPVASPTVFQEPPLCAELSLLALEQAPCAVLISDEQHRIVFFNAAAEALWNQPRDQALGRDAQAFVPGDIRHMHDSHGDPFDFPIERPDGQLLWTSLSLSRITAAGQVLHAAYLLRSTAQQAELPQYDLLTGLANRQMLLNQTDYLLHGMRRSSSCLALAFIELDRFKQVNERWGHEACNSMLVTLAARLRKARRNGDVVARLGSDEFVIVMPHCQPYQAAFDAQRLLASIGMALTMPDGAMMHPSASIGIAMFPEDGADAEHLLRHAALAMRQAKAEARHSYCFYREQMNSLAQEHSRLEADLQVALRQGGLELYYQPQVANLDPGHPLRGVEALLRWKHPILGPIPPLRFVALAEESGLMDALSHWVLEEACRQMAAWRAENLPIPHVSINLSASNLRNGRLPLQVASVLRRHGLLPGDLRVEVTETTVLDPNPMTLATTRALQAHGVLLSMDDFGTGYSSLAALYSLPISTIKLDKSFINDIVHSQSARALTAAVLHIGESLGLEVVAEGVETEEQRSLLQALGCSVVQGYLFARPMPPAGLQTWLAQRG